MNLREISKRGRLAFIHSPKHFFPNSFHLIQEGGRLVVMGRVRPRVGKGFRKVAILK